MAHTPAPWRITTGPQGYAIEGDEIVVADIVEPRRENAQDDARLIAAAPELLELARKLAWSDSARYMEKGYDTAGINALYDLRAVLKKLEGC